MSCDSCEIKNLVYQYADLIDRGELRAMAGLFRRGKIVTADDAGKPVEIVGEEAVHAMNSSFVRIYPDNGTPHTMHLTSNVQVQVDQEAGTASARTYAVVFQAVEDFPLQPVISVRYADRFARDDEGWYFTERRINSSLFGDLSQHLLQKPPGS